MVRSRAWIRFPSGDMTVRAPTRRADIFPISFSVLKEMKKEGRVRYIGVHTLLPPANFPIGGVSRQLESIMTNETIDFGLERRLILCNCLLGAPKSLQQISVGCSYFGVSPIHSDSSSE